MANGSLMRSRWCFTIGCLLAATGSAGPFLHPSHTEVAFVAGDGEENEEDTADLRRAAARPVSWIRSGYPLPDHHRAETVRILAINDFHGHLSSGRRVDDRPVGGAAVLAAYLKAASDDSSSPGSTLIVHAGDHVGASAPESAFLQDEPSIEFFNRLGNRHCRHSDRMHPECNLVGTPGNHEFDEGKDELLRLIEGGGHPSGPFLDAHYRGATFPYVSANVVDQTTGLPLLPPFVVKTVKGVRLAFIGAVLADTPAIVTPTGVAGLEFRDEAQSINRYVRRLREQEGIHAFVVLIHQGGRQTAYEGPTQGDGQVVGAELLHIVSRLDDDVDVVISGHSHTFTNALLKNNHEKDILVTQAFSFGTAYADIRLMIDRRTEEILAKQASVVTAFADVPPGLTPDRDVEGLVARAEARVQPLVTRVVGEAAHPVLRAENEAGESPLGHLIADAQRAALGTDFAFMNPGGIRTDLPGGALTYRDLFLVQPFGNTLIRMTLTGQDIYDLLNQQWLSQPQPRMLKVSGLTYTWDRERAVDDRVVDVRRQEVPIDRTATYSVTVNDFLAAGGDHFSVLRRGGNRTAGPVDIAAVVSYIERLPRPFTPPGERRITRLH